MFPRGAWVAQLGKRLPLAEVMIWEFWDGAPRQAPSSVESLLLRLPLTCSCFSLSISLSLSDKYTIKKKEKPIF